jgi:hypothetical protein
MQGAGLLSVPRCFFRYVAVRPARRVTEIAANRAALTSASGVANLREAQTPNEKAPREAGPELWL